VTNAEPSEHNSILVVKVTQITIAREGLFIMQYTECTSIPLGLPESLSMDCQIRIFINQ